MKTHGTVIRSYHMPSDPRIWETAQRWRKRLFTRENLTMAAASLMVLLLFGLLIWAFCQSIETLNTAGFPSNLEFYIF